MPNGSTTLIGIEIPSTDPFFLAVVGIHIPLGVTCVIVGAVAMLNKKQRGRHSSFGEVYYWSLLALFGSATFLSVLRWTEDYHLFVFGAVSFASAWFGRKALQQRWLRVHLSGMGMSYILLLVAFYVDNGRQLPVWKVLPATPAQTPRRQSLRIKPPAQKIRITGNRKGGIRRADAWVLSTTGPIF